MKLKLKVIAAFTIGVGAGAVVGCQSYDFEPVKPLAIAQTNDTRNVAARGGRPNVLIVLDQSLSMDDPINPNDPSCQTGGSVCGAVSCGTPGTCPPACKTRISELQNAMQSFLNGSGTIARFGLVTFPTDCFCAAPTAYGDGGLSGLQVPIPQTNDDLTVLQAAANNISQKIAAIIPTGGTPTGNTLAAVGQYSVLLDQSRPNVVLLLTDGEPNCNSNNPHNCSNCDNNPPYCPTPADTAACNQCNCTLDCPLGTGNCPCPGANCRCKNYGAINYGALGCFDKDSTVNQVAQLKLKGIFVIPVGFGAETLDGGTGLAPIALNEMALAGGYPRQCDGGTLSCGAGDSCNPSTRICNRAYYQASTADQLIAALNEIRGRIPPGICEYTLTAAPDDPTLLAVRVDGRSIPAGPTTWRYSAGPPPKVTFADNSDVCISLKNADPSHPVRVEFLIVQQR